MAAFRTPYVASRLTFDLALLGFLDVCIFHREQESDSPVSRRPWAAESEAPGQANIMRLTCGGRWINLLHMYNVSVSRHQVKSRLAVALPPVPCTAR